MPPTARLIPAGNCISSSWCNGRGLRTSRLLSAMAPSIDEENKLTKVSSHHAVAHDANGEYHLINRPAPGVCISLRGYLALDSDHTTDLVLHACSNSPGRHRPRSSSQRQSRAEALHATETARHHAPKPYHALSVVPILSRRRAPDHVALDPSRRHHPARAGPGKCRGNRGVARGSDHTRGLRALEG